PARVARAAAECGAESLPVAEIHRIPVDIFAPCALGAILDDTTIPEIKAELITGGANNQLLEPRHGDQLLKRGIVYVPDYVANAGGVTYGGSVEFLQMAPDDA